MALIVPPAIFETCRREERDRRIGSRGGELPAFAPAKKSPSASRGGGGTIDKAKKRQNPCRSKSSDVNRRQVSSPEKWRRRESNPQTNCCNDLQDNHLQKSSFAQSVNGSHFGDSNRNELAQTDKDLVRVIDAWSVLPGCLRQAILTLVDASRNVEDNTARQ